MIRRILFIIYISWFAVAQTVLPTVVLAQEMLEATPSAALETGDGYATSQALTTVNTTLENSTLDVTQGDIVDQQGDVVLFEQNQDQESVGSPSANITSNELVVENTVIATTAATTIVTTGGNEQSANDNSDLATGDAYATAYATTVANTTLVNSNVEIALMTLLTEWDGNIVLDPQTVPTPSISPTVGILTIDNNGDVMTNSYATAVSGDNIQIASGDATLVTGDVTTSSSSTSLVNATLIDTLLFDFYVHNLSLWSGTVYNWSAPGSRETPDNVLGRYSSQAPIESCNACSRLTDITNSAEVVTTAVASANTGGNTQVTGGSGVITTGSAFASAKTASVVNTTLINSSYRLVDLTLFAPWTGNLIFAYPDLSVSVVAPSEVKPGESFVYTVDVTNSGYKTDTGVILLVDGNTEIIGKLEPFATVSHTFTKTAGSEDKSTITLNASVKGDLTEESMTNNTHSAIVSVNAKESPTNNTSISTEIPVINLTATTNIGTHIYSGDTIRFEVTIANKGPGIAYDIVFVNSLVAPDGTVVGKIQAPIGHISAGGQRQISFGLVTSPSLLAGQYYTVSSASGRSDNRTQIESNYVENPIPVKNKIIATVAAATKVEPNEKVATEGEVLGSTTSPACENCRYAGLVFAITTALSSLYTYAGRRKCSRRLLSMAIGWGGLGYISLILLNPECSHGLTLVSASPICTYFLPLAVGQALVQRLFILQKTPSPQLANGESVV